jgi:hypothetical protein
VKLAQVISSIAEVADPLNHFNPNAEDEKIAINTIPETYSGVAVDVMEKTDKLLSSFEPSRIPENIPSSNAAGIITNITVSISQPVRPNLLVNMSKAGSLKTVEYPQ